MIERIERTSHDNLALNNYMIERIENTKHDNLALNTYMIERSFLNKSGDFYQFHC